MAAIHSASTPTPSNAFLQLFRESPQVRQAIEKEFDAAVNAGDNVKAERIMDMWVQAYQAQSPVTQAQVAEASKIDPAKAPRPHEFPTDGATLQSKYAPATNAPAARPTPALTRSQFGKPFLTVHTAEQGGAAAANPAPIIAAPKESDLPDYPAGSAVSLANSPTNIAARRTQVLAAQGIKVTPAEEAAFATAVHNEAVEQGGIYEFDMGKVVHEHASAVRAKGVEVSPQEEQKAFAGALLSAREAGFDIGDGTTIITTGGNYAALQRRAALVPQGEQAAAAVADAAVADFFKTGGGGNWASGLMTNAGAVMLKTTNPVIGLIPGAAENVAALGVGGMLGTVGMMGRANSAMVGGASDPHGLNAVFPGLQGMENNIRSIMQQQVMAGAGGNSFFAALNGGGGSSGGDGGSALGAAGKAAFGGGILGSIGGAALSGVATIGGLNTIPGLRAGSPTGVEGVLYGDSKSRMKFHREQISDANSFLAATQNRAIDIDELIMMFAAYTMKTGENDIREFGRRATLKKQIEQKHALMQEQWNRRKGEVEFAARTAEAAGGALGSLGGPLGGMIGGLVGSKVADGIRKPWKLAEETGAKDAVFNAMSGQGLFSIDNESADSLQFKMQSAVEKYKRMYEMCSHLMKTRHDTSMTAVNNMRA